MSCGRCPTGMVATTRKVSVSIIETEPASKLTFATSGRRGLAAMLCGLAPTGRVEITSRVAVLITETWLDMWSAVKARRPSGENVTQCGAGAVLTCPMTAWAQTVVATDHYLSRFCFC